MKWQYSRESLHNAFMNLGIVPGDIVLVHSDIFILGLPKEFIERKENPCIVIYESIRSAIGENGTLIVPTFSYSFCKNQDFDPDHTPSDVGTFSNCIRQLPGAVRGRDPLFSFAAIGPEANIVNDFRGNNSFSPDSSALKNFYDRNIKILFIGVDLRYLTAIHLTEQVIAAPHRFDKIFSGRIKEGKETQNVRWIYPVRVNIPNTEPALEKLHDECLEAGILKKHPEMPIFCASLQPVLDLFAVRAKADPWHYLKGPKCDLAEEDYRRAGEENYAAELPGTTLEDMARILAPLPRHLVSDGYDAALNALASHFPLQIHDYPSGTRAFTWIAPERWICRSATLETLDGQKIFSHADNPLHVVSYAKPFSGVVSREELFAHLHVPSPAVAERYPDAIPFVFKYYERDWGLCCSATQKNALTDAAYRVTIDSDFSVGAVKVSEVLIEPERERERERERESKGCIVFCAHLCHPCQFNDGLSGVLAGLKLMERLRARKNRQYTYRLLILPETIGSACWLSHNLDKIPSLKGGIFLEMLATDYPHVLMHSNTPESWFDGVASLVVAAENAANRDVPFLEAPLNDERMFNATGIECPMCSLMRVAPREEMLWPYAEYHTSFDTCDRANFTNLEKSVCLLEKIVDAVESDAVPRPLWRGELFVSRFNGLNYKRDWRQLLEITYSMDGKRSISEIARLWKADFFEIKRVLDILEKEGLIVYEDRNYRK